MKLQCEHTVPSELAELEQLHIELNSQLYILAPHSDSHYSHKQVARSLVCMWSNTECGYVFLIIIANCLQVNHIV